MKKFILIVVMAVVNSLCVSADTLPAYPGGKEAMNDFIAQNIVYPDDCLDNMIEGTLIVSFDVDVDGSVKNVKIVRPLDPELEAEAVRVVTMMPAWTPATDASGNPVKQQVEIPVKFRLPN